MCNIPLHVQPTSLLLLGQMKVTVSETDERMGLSLLAGSHAAEDLVVWRSFLVLSLRSPSIAMTCRLQLEYTESVINT